MPLPPWFEPMGQEGHGLRDLLTKGALVETAGGWTWHFDPRRVTIDPNRQSAGATPVPCPAAYLYGEESVLVTPESIPRALDILPAGTPVIGIPNAAHHVLLDQPLALVSALRTLLATWPPGAMPAASAPRTSSQYGPASINQGANTP